MSYVNAGSVPQIDRLSSSQRKAAARLVRLAMGPGKNAMVRLANAVHRRSKHSSRYSAAGQSVSLPITSRDTAAAVAAKTLAAISASPAAIPLALADIGKAEAAKQASRTFDQLKKLTLGAVSDDQALDPGVSNTSAAGAKEGDASITLQDVKDTLEIVKDVVRFGQSVLGALMSLSKASPSSAPPREATSTSKPAGGGTYTFTQPVPQRGRSTSSSRSSGGGTSSSGRQADRSKQQRSQTQRPGMNPWVLIGGAAAAAYFLSRRR